MKTQRPIHCGKRGGYALMIVLVFTCIALVMLAGAMTWTSTTATLTQRNNQYYNAAAAAEAATEKVISQMARDFQMQGQAAVDYNLANYRAAVPTTAESATWADFAFSDAQGNGAQTYVNKTFDWAYTPLQSQYVGLYGLAATYRIVSNARAASGLNTNLIAGVKQEIQVSSIPLFQFAIFYSMDMELNPGANMNITGRVHTNGHLYTQPNSATLTYQGDVTAVQEVEEDDKDPDDPTSRNPGSVVFQGAHDSGVSSLNLPIGTNNSPAAVHAVVELPPAGEDPNSPMGQQRYYNKADLVILVSNDVVVATSGSWDGFGIAVPWAQASSFLNTNVTFYNARENKTVQATQLDVGALAQWSTTNSVVRPLLGRDVSSVFVADERAPSSGTEPGVRLVNGQSLPALGLTVATPDPLYVQGNYNAPSAYLGTTNTTTTLPASLVSDAITILSPAWSDANSTKSLTSRTAANSTVNAAIISGIVPSGNGHYSGGVENFPRFLENWSGKTFTYNGSIVGMFSSQIATGPWGGSGVYNPPNRNWAFDQNFMNASKLPPGTPMIRAIIRACWALVAPNTTS
ncbi:MAG: hypothetical protein KGS61_02625 [Verrucomicrobia bacterium]|nr:hypothetical protein [Verrucomicrobiota bacterium]